MIKEKNEMVYRYGNQIQTTHRKQKHTQSAQVKLMRNDTQL